LQHHPNAINRYLVACRTARPRGARLQINCPGPSIIAMAIKSIVTATGCDIKTLSLNLASSTYMSATMEEITA
jgi:hypothetical protein